MKKTFLTITACAFAATVFAQKATIIQQIQEKSVPIYAYAADKTITYNLSESMWSKATGTEVHPLGYMTTKGMAKAFIDLSDKFGETYIDKKCGFTVNTVDEKENRPGCMKAVDAWSGKYSLVVNAKNVEGTRDGYKMVFGYVSSVAIYLEDGSASLWHHGFTPKSDKLHVIINADNKFKTVTTSWSADGTTFTINAPGDIETAGWDGKIETGLKAGWKG